MGNERVHIVVAAEDRAAYRAAADRQGLTLSAWLREAADAKLAEQEAAALATVEDLDQFFAACDEREGDGPEPDWSEHRAVIEASRRTPEPT